MKIFAVRLKGRVGVRKEINSALDTLGLKYRYNAIICDATPEVMGVLKKSLNYITYGEIDDAHYSKIVTLPSSMKIERGKRILLRLPPPKGGFPKKIKILYPHGEAGYRGAEINKLIDKFIENIKM